MDGSHRAMELIPYESREGREIVLYVIFPLHHSLLRSDENKFEFRFVPSTFVHTSQFCTKINNVLGVITMLS